MYKHKRLFALSILFILLSTYHIFLSSKDASIAQDVSPPSFPEHQVKAGETLSSIAEKYHINVYTLAAVNRIDNINKLTLTRVVIRTLNVEEVEYIIDLVLANDIVSHEERAHLAKTIYEESVQYEVDPMIPLAIMGVESDWNPHVFVLYVQLPKKSNLPPRFKELQDKVALVYNCRNPSKYRPDIGLMQISYKAAKADLDLNPEDTCRLHFDYGFNVKQGIKLLNIKKQRFYTKYINWYATYHSANKDYMKVYQKNLNTKFYNMYKMLIERD